jgi:pyridoxal phosphate enzyme (YggS family)
MNTVKITLKNQLKKNLQQLESEIQSACEEAQRSRSEVELICVTKNQSLDAIEALIDLGFVQFGENRAQELVPKAQSLQDKYPNQIKWHFIGHLQSNKIKAILPWVSVLHSLDRLSLAEKLNQELAKESRKLSCFVEIKTTTDEHKTGFLPEELNTSLVLLSRLSQLKLIGLMTMAPLTQDSSRIEHSFLTLKKHRDELSSRYPSLRLLSMGMSQDFRQAILAGATHIRIGSRIFTGI